MEDMTIYFSHDTQNDTVIKYSTNSDGSHLTCEFTSEDPDFETETLYLNSDQAEPAEQMMHDLLSELSCYLDETDSGPCDDSLLSFLFDDYSRTTLIAVNNALIFALESVVA